MRLKEKIKQKIKMFLLKTKQLKNRILHNTRLLLDKKVDFSNIYNSNKVKHIILQTLFFLINTFIFSLGINYCIKYFYCRYNYTIQSIFYLQLLLLFIVFIIGSLQDIVELNIKWYFDKIYNKYLSDIKNDLKQK